jgi:mannitol/fructose-specific phosphotransferase system IIA component (Ntr-type)
MARIRDLLTHGAVKLNMTPGSKKEWIEQLVDLLVRTYSLENRRDEILDAVLQREGTLSTAIGSGLAFPHAKTDAVPRIVLAMGIAPGGVEFGAPDGRKVQIAFVLASPSTEVGAHVRALSAVSRIMSGGGMTEKLVNAKDIDEVISILYKAEEGLQ